MRPVDSRYPVTLGYRGKMRSRPTYIHRGIDYGVPTGTRVHATTTGTVVHAGRGGMGSAFGIHVVIKTGKIWHLYAHLSKADVKRGAVVRMGDPLGRSGATGNVTGPHLHYAEFTRYVYTADRTPAFISLTTPTVWARLAFLNIKGDDDKGAASLAGRLPTIARDLAKSGPHVTGLCEVRAGQVPALRAALKPHGMTVAAHAGGNALVVRDGTPVEKAAPYTLPGGKGRPESLLRARVQVGGTWLHIGVTHLDYRDGLDAVRVRQAKSALAAMTRYGVRYNVRALDRSVILLDENSRTWTRDKAFKPAKFKTVVKKGIDAIYTGSKRPADGDSRSTASDHPILTATLYRK